jgi:hypothetical protein
MSKNNPWEQAQQTIDRGKEELLDSLSSQEKDLLNETLTLIAQHMVPKGEGGCYDDMGFAMLCERIAQGNTNSTFDPKINDNNELRELFGKTLNEANDSLYFMFTDVYRAEMGWEN